ncbi:Anaerobic glycerol-3-phosphate dehydrogenase subunit A (EC [Olavius algarvensis associated proteobacterium Delta 3]|nr:Anaerobic glycerol-3-phosphate dehydrogenase subunit A (EC [Olavius algarvensis associated proteobacterium Delta 3]
MKTQVLIIGSGVTGTSLARDLSLRGVECLLIDKGDFNAGASGGNHGLLHSGARYILSDPASAMECQQESRLLKKLAPQCIDNSGGVFVAREGDDENYVADFSPLCKRYGIPAEPMAISDALAMEPALTNKLIAAYSVNDASIDPFKLSIDNIADAGRHGAIFMPYKEATGFERRNHRLQRVQLTDTLSGHTMSVEADQVVNACGAWAGHIASAVLGGTPLTMVYSKGTLLVTQTRIARQVINRLRKPTDGDILVPGGTVSILGTTSVRIHSPDDFRPTVEEVDHIIAEGTAMMPILEHTRYIRAYAGIRPLIESSSAEDDRSVSRGYALIDHTDAGIENFVTVTGGKLTTFRLMAEKAANLICARLGVDAPCRTRTDPLPDTPDGKWTEPGRAPRHWFQNCSPEDVLLCECEMIPKSVVDNVVQTIRKQNGRPSLVAIGKRSRMGKGPCQGTFCGSRVTAHLYDQGIFEARQGITDLKRFLSARWRGQKPLMWGAPLIQAELQEAMQCGLLGLELEPDKP